MNSKSNNNSPSKATNRCYQITLIGSTLALSWLGMMIVHESGHVLFAWLSGGTVSKVVLYPLDFSRTDLSHNPHPLFVASGGALIGSALPLITLFICKRTRPTVLPIIQFFAGFCLIVNGIYMSVVSFLHAADAGDLMRAGTPQWILVAFGIITVPLGLSLWHGLGPHYGLGSQPRKQINPMLAFVTLVTLLTVIIIEILVNSR
jgi:hypothetical protein